VGSIQPGRKALAAERCAAGRRSRGEWAEGGPDSVQTFRRAALGSGRIHRVPNAYSGRSLVGLIVGYWVVAARPRDPNAWLVLMLLSFQETAFGNLDWTFWAGPSYVVFGVWNQVLQILSFVALLWFGIYFPERWRLDVRWPQLKWLILAIGVYGTAVELWVNIARRFDVRRMQSLVGFEWWNGRIANWTLVVCVVVFLIALFDKLRSASTQDARRRLRVLATGSGLSLGPLLLMFGLLPYIGQDPHHGSMFEMAVPFFGSLSTYVGLRCDCAARDGRANSAAHGDEVFGC
jgi:hypothetical protein